MNTLPYSSFVPVFHVSQRRNKINQRYDRAGVAQLPNPYKYPQEYDLRVIAIRHAERVDTNLGDNWYKLIFNDEPNARGELYGHPQLPSRLPRRNPSFHYILDPPITKQGEQLSIAKGQRLLSQYLRVDRCYSSPAARVVLTADALLRGMGLHRRVPIKLDPYVFEPMTWNTALQNFQQVTPCMSKGQWLRSNFNIDTRYTPLSFFLDPYEDEYRYFIRTQNFFDREITPAMQNYPAQGHGYGAEQPFTVLIVGHAATPVVFSRIARGRNGSLSAFQKECEKVNFLGQAVLYRYRHTGQWVDSREFQR